MSGVIWMDWPLHYSYGLTAVHRTPTIQWIMTLPQITVDPLSFVSLLIQTKCKGLPLGRATGFLVLKKNQHYLITNWHVLAGRHPLTNKPLSHFTVPKCNGLTFAWKG